MALTHVIRVYVSTLACVAIRSLCDCDVHNSDTLIAFVSISRLQACVGVAASSVVEREPFLSDVMQQAVCSTDV